MYDVPELYCINSIKCGKAFLSSIQQIQSYYMAVKYNADIPYCYVQREWYDNYKKFNKM